MTHPTLILTPRVTPDTVAMADAAQKTGWSVVRLENWRAPKSLAGEDIVVYGEPLFAQVVADTLELALIETPFDWLASLPQPYLLRTVRYTTLAEARAHPEPAFIKPVDDKCFVAKVYAPGEEPPAFSALPGDLPVLLAEPVTWEVEYRCFVLDRRIMTLSPYQRNGELAQNDDGVWPTTSDETEQIQAFITALLADLSVPLPPVIALDVGRIHGRGWAVVEANAAWGSGIYGCDPLRVLSVLRRACVQRKLLTQEDSRWVIERGGIEW